MWNLTDTSHAIACDVQKNISRKHFYIAQLFRMFREKINEAITAEVIIIDVLAAYQRNCTAVWSCT